MSLKTTEWHYRLFPDRDFSTKDQLEFSKDYDRILYSTAFRRLGGVTQVVAANEIALFHTRLTHSLKTAQVGTRLANHLIAKYDSPRWQNIIKEHGGLESRVVRAACLAHDLGHPPFGHIAEAELQHATSQWANEVSPKRTDSRAIIDVSPKISLDYQLRDRFEGNAQSFRIVTKLASREPPEHPSECPALNLTRGTLAAMLKYPWGRDELPRGVGNEKLSKWGYYDTENEIASWIFADEGRPSGREVNLRDREYEYRTLEAQVMDWADDISYAVHDIEDFFRAGLIPLDRLAVSPNEWEQFFSYAWQRKLSGLFSDIGEDQVKRWVEGIVFKLFPQTAYEGSGQDRLFLHKFASTVIRDVTNGTQLLQNGTVVAEDENLAVIELLKQLTWYYVIDRPSLESVQRGQRRLIRSLYCNLIEWVEEVWEGPSKLTSGQRRELPARLLEFLNISFLHDPPPRDADARSADSKRISRAVIDYIVSLTEGQTVALNARLTGQAPGSMLDSWSHL